MIPIWTQIRERLLENRVLCRLQEQISIDVWTQVGKNLSRVVSREVPNFTLMIEEIIKNDRRI